MKLNYKFVFLDLDDTIWDFHNNAREALRTVFFEEKLNEYYDDFEQFYCVYSKKNLELWIQYGQGLITKDFLIENRFAHLLSLIGIDNRPLALKMNTGYLNSLSTQTELKPHAIELLEFCRGNNMAITLVSNGFAEVQHRKIQSSGIKHYLAHVVLSETAGALKPDPAIFEYALRLNKAQASETLMIGDNYDADIVGAVRANIDALFLNNTDNKFDIPEGVKEIKSLKEAIEFLRCKLSV